MLVTNFLNLVEDYKGDGKSRKEQVFVDYRH